MRHAAELFCGSHSCRYHPCHPGRKVGGKKETELRPGLAFPETCVYPPHVRIRIRWVTYWNVLLCRWIINNSYREPRGLYKRHYWAMTFHPTQVADDKTMNGKGQGIADRRWWSIKAVVAVLKPAKSGGGASWLTHAHDYHLSPSCNGDTRCAKNTRSFHTSDGNSHIANRYAGKAR